MNEQWKQKKGTCQEARGPIDIMVVEMGVDGENRRGDSDDAVARAHVVRVRAPQWNDRRAYGNNAIYMRTVR